MSHLIILASASPRRKALLQQMGIKHKSVHPDCNEPAREPNEKPEMLCCRTACLKAASVAKHYPDNPILAADTIVVIDNFILGKPASKHDIRNMITRLSGREHSVFSGLALVLPDQQPVIRHCETKVVFRNLSDKEISWYTESADCLDKAGAYGIQSLGGLLVKEIRGDWYNVVGLPVPLLIDLLMCYCPELWPPV